MNTSRDGRPELRPPDPQHLRLAISDTLDGPISVTGRRLPPASSERRRTCLYMTGVWAALVGLVVLALASDGEFSRDDWCALAVVVLAGWPVLRVVAHLARHPESSAMPDEDTPTIVMRRGTRVDDLFVQLLAGLAGLDVVELGSLNGKRVS